MRHLFRTLCCLCMAVSLSTFVTAYADTGRDGLRTASSAKSGDTRRPGRQETSDRGKHTNGSPKRDKNVTPNRKKDNFTPISKPGNGGGNNNQGGGIRPGHGGGNNNQGGGVRPGHGGGVRPGHGGNNNNQGGGVRPGHGGGNNNHGGGVRPGHGGGNNNHGGGIRPGHGGGNNNHGGGIRPGHGGGNHGFPGHGAVRPGHGGGNHGFPGHGAVRPGHGGSHGVWWQGPTPPPPPVRPYRPPMRPWGRPVPPPGWRMRPSAPSVGTILGLALGTAFATSLDYLANSGYTIDGYQNGTVYLCDINQYGFIWPDAMLMYDNGALAGSEYYYTAPAYDMTRYSALYNRFYSMYGMPMMNRNPAIGLTTATWFGPNNCYITLEYGPRTMSGVVRYCTGLRIGLY